MMKVSSTLTLLSTQSFQSWFMNFLEVKLSGQEMTWMSYMTLTGCLHYNLIRYLICFLRDKNVPNNSLWAHLGNHQKKQLLGIYYTTISVKRFLFACCSLSSDWQEALVKHSQPSAKQVPTVYDWYLLGRWLTMLGKCFPPITWQGEQANRKRLTEMVVYTIHCAMKVVFMAFKKC